MNRAFTHAPAFWKWLEERARSTKEHEQAFIARNFQLDERVTPDLAKTYWEKISDQTLDDLPRWRTSHQEYLRRDGRLLHHSKLLPPTRITQTSEESCPASFRDSTTLAFANGELGRSDLLRIQRLDRISHRARCNYDNLHQLCHRLMSGEADERDRGDLQTILDTWTAESWWAPTFAAISVDVADIVPPNAPPTSTWPDKLRDQFGLLQHDADADDITVILLRYPIKALPPIDDQPHLIPLAAPSVLDCELFPAFCPSPSLDRSEAKMGCGYLVDLSASLGPFPVREVLHPPIRLMVDHIWKIGQITTLIPDLTHARFSHLRRIREHTAREDYGRQTDPESI